MRDEALFLNGVWEDVLKEILVIQSVLPEQIMFLQPYSARAMRHLQDDPPTVDSPLLLLLSLTTDLSTVHYAAEVVGWDDKRTMGEERQRAINRLIWTLQPGEGGLYDLSRSQAGQSANLLHIRRLRKVRQAFDVSLLVKTTDGTPIAGARMTAGGWTYVATRGLDTLLG